MAERWATQFPCRVVVRAMDCGGDGYEWAVFAQGNYIESFADRSEAERVARRVSADLVDLGEKP